MMIERNVLERIEFDAEHRPTAEELAAFYERQNHRATHDPAKLRRMIDESLCFVAARLDGELIGWARGVSDGFWGRLAECKLDPRFQGPACITRTDGRIEHDSRGIAAEMALRVIESLRGNGVERIVCLAYGTEVDFCKELGFRRLTGLTALELDSTTPLPNRPVREVPPAP